MEPILGAALVASLALNGFLIYLAKSLRKKPRPDLTAQELLHDLTRRGHAVLQVQVIDPEQIFLRRPQG